MSSLSFFHHWKFVLFFNWVFNKKLNYYSVPNLEGRKERRKDGGREKGLQVLLFHFIHFFQLFFHYRMFVYFWIFFSFVSFLLLLWSFFNLYSVMEVFLYEMKKSQKVLNFWNTILKNKVYSWFEEMSAYFFWGYMLMIINKDVKIIIRMLQVSHEKIVYLLRR